MHKRENLEGIQQLFELTESKRNNADVWLQEVLQEDRDGCESWEVYCFTHGLPTLNPGSWLASIDKPTCGDALCLTLKARWDLAWRKFRVPWKERQLMECTLCQDERQRRCCIISQQNDSKKHCTGIFSLAPYVHPFRSPTNQAQRLRSLHFARERESRLLWVVAYDKLKSKDKVSEKGQSKEALQTWLTLDDRRTAGIPGFLPLVLDLPIRFTCEPVQGDRLKGVFTNARGWLRGWNLTEQEAQSVEQSTEPEIALQGRPIALYIQMATPHQDLELIDGRRIYILRSLWRSWYKDGDARQVEIQRCGFPIVPDFGGRFERAEEDHSQRMNSL